jgi:hypothetical protein
MGKKAAIKLLPHRNECHTVQCSHVKAQSVFGNLIRPVDLGDGLNRMADWVCETGVPESKSAAFKIEIEDQLPESWRNALKV